MGHHEITEKSESFPESEFQCTKSWDKSVPTDFSFNSVYFRNIDLSQFFFQYTDFGCPRFSASKIHGV